MSVWALARKDLRLYFRDRAGLAVGLGVPVALATVFGLVFGALNGGDDPSPRARIYVEDRDDTPASRDLVAALQAARGLRVTVVDPAEVDADGDGSARHHVADGDAPLGLLVPAGYGARLEGGEAPLRLFRDPAKEIEQEIALAGLLPALFQAGGENLGRRVLDKSLDVLDFPIAGRGEARAILDDTWQRFETLVEGLDLGTGTVHAAGDEIRPAPAGGEGMIGSGGEESGKKERAAGDAAEAPDGAGGKAAAADDDEEGFDVASAAADLLGLEVEDVVGGSNAKHARKVATQAHSVSGIAVMMLLFGLVACGSTILEEEERGTLDRLRLTPRVSILGGKFLFAWTIGLIQLAVLFAYGAVVFQVPIFRAPLALVVHSSAVAAAAVGFGILFAVLCRSRKQLEGLSTIVILTMSALGGSWFPLVLAPDWVQRLGHVTLTAWAMDGYQAIFWYEKGLLDIVPEILVLLGIAAGTGLVALHLWRRRLAT